MSKENLLYVDDEEINLQLFELNFKPYFNLFLAEDAEKGLEIFRNHDISTVISDYKMPDKNGYDFLKEVREIKPDTRCFLLSAYIKTEMKNKVDDKSIVEEYISKPWKKEHILKLIKG